MATCVRCLLALILLLLSGAAAGVDSHDPPPVQPRELRPIRQGPGSTFLATNQLNWGDDITLLERTRLGNWVRVRVERGAQSLSGWVMTGHLIFADGVQLSGVPVNPTVPDADLSYINSQTLSQLYRVPVIPRIDPTMHAVYEHGQALGNDPGRVIKIGDSVSASPVFLSPLADGDHQLGPFDFLAPIIAAYDAPTQEESAASRVGLNSYSLFDPLWAPDYCQPNETPLDCELRRQRPAVAFVLLGGNDARSIFTEDDYREQMRQIVERTLDAGTIPVLITLSVDPEDEYWWKVLHFNLVLVDLAETYRVPLVNLWLAAEALPNHGLTGDGIHMQHSGFDTFHYSTGHDAYYGISLQNLVALGALYEIHQLIHLPTPTLLEE